MDRFQVKVNVCYKTKRMQRIENSEFMLTFRAPQDPFRALQDPFRAPPFARWSHDGPYKKLPLGPLAPLELWTPLSPPPLRIKNLWVRMGLM